ESGPDHQKSFRAVAKVGGLVWGEGEGRTKKEAEQQAAEAAWTAISARASAAAGEDEPGQHEPGHDEPAQDEPAQDEPAQDELGQDRPGQDGSGQDDPGQSDIGAAAADAGGSTRARRPRRAQRECGWPTEPEQPEGGAGG